MKNRKIWFSIVAILFSFVTLTAQAKYKLEGKVIDSECGEVIHSGLTGELRWWLSPAEYY